MPTGTTCKSIRTKSVTHVSGMDPGKLGAPGKIRTPDPQIRSLVLYPAELPVPSRRDGCPAFSVRLCAEDWTYLAGCSGKRKRRIAYTGEWAHAGRQASWPCRGSALAMARPIARDRQSAAVEPNMARSSLGCSPSAVLPVASAKTVSPS